MLQLPLGRLIATYQKLAEFGGTLARQRAARHLMMVSEVAWKEMVAAASEFQGLCQDVGLPVTELAARRVCAELGRGSALPNGQWGFVGHEDLARAENALNQMCGCMSHESSTKVAMVLASEKAYLFEPITPLFGAEVEVNFPGLAYDIEEAGKCLALGRSTAGAFHAIRCLEGGITAISRCLAIPDPTKGADRNWGAMLTKIKVEIDRRWPGASARFSGDGATFETLYGSLAAIQNPYRNATMHFDQVYTEEAAKHIFDMVGGLMRQVASRMDEDGRPQA